jgi:DNA-binding response OmpR family regulator
MLRTIANLSNILVVEDELVTGMFIREALQAAGFRVELTASAEEARQRFETVTADFDAAIIDVGLPGARGDELVQEIRERRPDLPIIIATGLTETVLIERLASDPKLLTIDKPYDSHVLVAALAVFDVRPIERPIRSHSGSPNA